MNEIPIITPYTSVFYISHSRLVIYCFNSSIILLTTILYSHRSSLASTTTAAFVRPRQPTANQLITSKTMTSLSLYDELWDEKNTANDACPVVRDLQQLFTRTGFATQPICSVAAADDETTLFGIGVALRFLKRQTRQDFYRRSVSLKSYTSLIRHTYHVTISSSPR